MGAPVSNQRLNKLITMCSEGKKIKGIKLKGRQACVGTSHRRNDALEKVTRKRKCLTKVSSHIQQLTLT